MSVTFNQADEKPAKDFLDNLGFTKFTSTSHPVMSAVEKKRGQIGKHNTTAPMFQQKTSSSNKNGSRSHNALSNTEKTGTTSTVQGLTVRGASEPMDIVPICNAVLADLTAMQAEARAKGIKIEGLEGGNAVEYQILRDIATTCPSDHELYEGCQAVVKDMDARLEALDREAQSHVSQGDYHVCQGPEETPSWLHEVARREEDGAQRGVVDYTYQIYAGSYIKPRIRAPLPSSGCQSATHKPLTSFEGSFPAADTRIYHDLAVRLSNGIPVDRPTAEQLASDADSESNILQRVSQPYRYTTITTESGAMLVTGGPPASSGIQRVGKEEFTTFSSGNGVRNAAAAHPKDNKTTSIGGSANGGVHVYTSHALTTHSSSPRAEVLPVSACGCHHPVIATGRADDLGQRVDSGTALLDAARVGASKPSLCGPGSQDGSATGDGAAGARFDSTTFTTQIDRISILIDSLRTQNTTAESSLSPSARAFLEGLRLGRASIHPSSTTNLSQAAAAVLERLEKEEEVKPAAADDDNEVPAPDEEEVRKHALWLEAVTRKWQPEAHPGEEKPDGWKAGAL